MNNETSDPTPLMPPAPPSITPASNNKFMGIIAALVVVVAVLVTVVAMSGSKTSTGTTPTTIRTSTLDPIGEGDIAPVNKYDAYYDHVLNNSGQANTEAKADIIEFGDLVCQSLDDGQTVAAVARVITGASTSASDLELGAAVIYGAITYLCGEYAGNLRAYLAS